MSGRGSVGHHLHVAHLGDVGGVALCRCAIAAQLLGARLGFSQVARYDEDLAAALRKHLGDALADTFAATRDDDSTGPRLTSA